MSKNLNPSQQDMNQYSAREHDTENDAKRVIIVGGEGINIQADIKIPEAQVIEIPTIIKEIERIEIPVIIKEVEIRTIEVPVIIKETQVITVEKPIITTIYEKIEVPVIVNQPGPTVEKVKESFPLVIKIILGIQALCSVFQVINCYLK